MANNQLLEGFAAANSGDLQRRLTDSFDTVLAGDDEAAATHLKAEMDRILQERIDALGQDQT